VTDVDLEGFFWIDDPQRRVRGRLAFSDSNIGKLALEDTLRPVSRAARDKTDVICGTSLLGEPMCLLDCFVHQHVSAGEVQYRQSWTVNRTLIGTHDPDPQVIGLSALIENFELLYGIPLIDVKG
jgi:ApeA N-terminal domain 1